MYVSLREMKLTQDQVEHIATLARIQLSDAEKNKFADELSRILDYVEQLGEVQTDDVEPIRQITRAENVMARDVAQQAELKEVLLGSAPTSTEDYVKVPSVFQRKT